MQKVQHDDASEGLELDAGPENQRWTNDKRAPQSRSPVGAAVIILTCILFIAVLYTLKLAAGLIIPLAIAAFLSLLLSPFVRRLVALRVPRVLAAGLMVLTVIGLLVTGIVLLAEPAQEWISEAPEHVRTIQYRMVSAKGHLADIKALAEEVDELSNVEPANSAQPVVVQEAGALANFLLELPARTAAFVVIIFLTFFLLSAGDDLLRRLTHCGRNFAERRRIVVIARGIQSDVSMYLLYITIINIVLGLATALTMHLLGVPNPLLWGAMAGIFNFAPYIGALVSTAILTVVGFATFPDLGAALLVPGAFLALTIFEGQLITPLIVGRKMSLNPTIIFVAVVFWGWMWGIAGALMAVPIIASTNVLLTHNPPLAQLGAIIQGNMRRRLRRRKRGKA